MRLVNTYMINRETYARHESKLILHMEIQQFLITTVMSKLKLNKFTVGKLTPEECANIQGGAETLTPIYTIVVTTTECLTREGCLTNHPGTEDSCGLCTTHYMCPD